jgi:hypothetical protein
MSSDGAKLMIGLIVVSQILLCNPDASLLTSPLTLVVRPEEGVVVAAIPEIQRGHVAALWLGLKHYVLEKLRGKQ